jgi:hypothetical protein
LFLRDILSRYLCRLSALLPALASPELVPRPCNIFAADLVIWAKPAAVHAASPAAHLAAFEMANGGAICGNRLIARQQ